MVEEQEAFIEPAIYLIPLILIVWTIALNGRPTALHSFVGTSSVIELSGLRNELGVRKKQESSEINISGLAPMWDLKSTGDRATSSSIGR